MIPTQWKVIVAIAGSVCLHSALAGAQSAALIGVSGLAFDSLRNAPLPGASINLSGLGVAKSTISDAQGLFRFDSVAPGTYALVMYHATLDSIGLAGVSKQIAVSDGVGTLQIATPSFAALWRAACGTAMPPTDSGFVFGAVREVLHESPVASATISLSWMQLSVDSSRRTPKAKGLQGLSAVTQRWGGDVRTDSRGNYAVCGVPTDVALQVAATNGTAVTGLLDLPPLDEHSRIRRQDLLLGAATDSGKPKLRGVVAGRVVAATGQGVAGARVIVDGTGEVRTRSDGRYVVPNVPLGTREIEVLSVGAGPFIAAIDVKAKDTAIVDVTLQRITALGAVKVTARTARERRFEAIQARVQAGLGHYLDSTRVGVHSSIVNAISMIAKPKDVCMLLLDGVKYTGPDMGMELKFRSPEDIALIEVYRYTESPMEYRDLRCSHANDQYLLVWTKLNIR